MKRLIMALLGVLGIYFAPDNYVIPVLRWGLYHRSKGPGFVFTIPLIERALPPRKTSIYVGDYRFDEVMSKDNIPFKVRMTILFTFDPNQAVKNAAAVLVRAEAGLLDTIMKDYANQGLRRLAARYKAEELTGELPMSAIERDLTHFLTAELNPLGMAPLRSGGVLIKETIAPEKFKRGLLNAGRFEAMLQTLTGYHALGNLIQQAIQAGLVTGLEDLDGQLTFLPELEGLRSPRALDVSSYDMPVHNGYNGRNGH